MQVYSYFSETENNFKCYLGGKKTASPNSSCISQVPEKNTSEKIKEKE